ncbi:hypothetical protein [Aquimarina sp. 2201CG5-10]|uniref:hypothetical protein n=1 Tax=Aquimarina callyspongiae TaxID=3098150 RepID=UPI002AB53A63|nr:hypothetical protein [Aquimarina sp. 2201CG5-10]MDY8134430.1 hypothetical protein [Aquimarina sp. 2201CG5-10]
MKKISIYIITLGFLISCTDNLKDATDFTSVENPNLSETSIVGQPNSATIWLQGIERELSITLNEILILAELGSDNYTNTQTFFSQFLDGLEIRVDDPDIRDTQFRIARMRIAAKFGLEAVGPGDSEYTTATEAEFNFFEGMSYLYAGMYFSALPQEELGAPISSAENFASAISSFETAISLNPRAEYYLAVARANYYLGNQAAAVSAAQSALGLDSDFLRSATYDELNGPSNRMEDALFERATFDDFQPLPTLDFLDPKYSFLNPNQDASVHYLKAEEAYLILAEANLADGNVTGAQGNLEDLLTVVGTREVRSIDDSIEGRSEVDPGGRPDNTGVVVNGRSGLVLDRQAGNINVPSVSGTSLVQADIDAMTAGDPSLVLLYRTRQEIFISEGLRFADMGIKLVIHENEILQNPNITDGDPSTLPVIPSFINAVVANLDAITYDAGAGVATTVINLSQVLVDNKTSNEVLPFH